MHYRSGGGGRRRFTSDDLTDSGPPQVTWGLVRRVLGYARPYAGLLAVTLGLLALTTALELVAPLIIRELLDDVLPNRDRARLNLLALALVAVPLGSALLRIGVRYLNARVGEGVIYDLRVALYTHLQRMSLRFFTNTKTGELMSRLNSDVVNAQSAISDTILDILTNLLRVAATLAVMLALEWRMTLLGMIVLPGFIFFAQRVGKQLRVLAREGMERNASMNARMNETLNVSGALLVKLFGRRDDEVRQFGRDAAAVRDIGVRRAVVGTRLFAFIGQVGAFGTALVFWVGGLLTMDPASTFTIGTLVAFSTYLAQLYGPLQALASAPVAFTTSVVSFERVFEIVDLPLDITERPDALRPASVQGALTFDDVSFSYTRSDEGLLSAVQRVGADALVNRDDDRPDADAPPAPAPGDDTPRTQARITALHNISLGIAPGQLVALVGPSGAGKTTLTYLIPRLYDPTGGRILLDGHDLRDLSLDALADAVGMVTQETFLFHDTVRANLLYARPRATQAELEAACRAANIHDFIMALPDGYDTLVGERGYRLSGGEKQRLALARVILKDPAILVLDEATSSLDSESEALIQQALARVMQGRTSIVIAHRLSTVRSADVIAVLDRGQIVERGTHEGLLAQNGLYASLYATQFGTQALAADAHTYEDRA